MSEIYPGRRSLYKYASPEAAEAILKSKTVRYSSPLTFNDPFDVQSGLHFDFELEDLVGKIVNHIERYAKSPNPPVVDKNHPFGQLAMIARKKLPKYGFDKQAWLDMMQPSFNADLIPIILQTQTDIQNYWGTSLPAMRVFCVSEERDNLLMWSHYAKDHTGAVFEFLSLPDSGNALSAAQKVEYVESPPPFFNEQEWLDDFITIKPFDNNLLHQRYVLHKSQEWNYENEWRVWYPNSATEGYHDYIPITYDEFPALFIGCRADSTFVDNITALTRANFPTTRIFKAKRRIGLYRLEYTEI